MEQKLYKKVYVTIVGGPECGRRAVVYTPCSVVLLPEEIDHTSLMESSFDGANASIPQVELPIRPTPNGLRAYWSERNKE